MAAKKKTLRYDQVVLVAVGCLIVGYLLGIGTALVIQKGPVVATTPVQAPAPSVAPPSSALGNLSSEIREFRSIVEQDPDNYSAWVRLGNLYFDTDQYQEAINAYTRALEIQPGDPNVMTDMGIMYRRLGDFQHAIELFREAAQLDPSHLNSLLNLGVVLRYDLNDIPAAISAWQRYLERNPPAQMADNIRKEIDTLRSQIQ